MACRQMLAVLGVAVVAMATLSAMARAAEYVVGDDMGWGLRVNYADWARGKEFRVGDSLVFRYNPGNHNVLGVSGPDFQACNKASTQVMMRSHSQVQEKDGTSVARPGTVNPARSSSSLSFQACSLPLHPPPLPPLFPVPPARLRYLVTRV